MTLERKREFVSTIENRKFYSREKEDHPTRISGIKYFLKVDMAG